MFVGDGLISVYNVMIMMLLLLFLTFGQSKREDMSKLFQQMKESGEASVQGKTDMDQQFAHILQGGKGQAKRHFAVDESLYGTQEGAASLKAAEQKIEADKKKRKKKKKPKKKSAVKDKDDNKDTGTNKQRSAVAVAGGAAVGMVAILALFIGRGAKPQ
jgi:hypothetical protein